MTRDQLIRLNDGIVATAACIYKGEHPALVIKNTGNLSIGDHFYRKGHVWKIVSQKRAICADSFPEEDMKDLAGWFKEYRMPPEFPEEVKDMSVDIDGAKLLAAAVYKESTRGLIRLYTLQKRRIWRTLPEVWNERKLDRAIKEDEYWFYDNPFRGAFSLDPDYFIRKCRIAVFGKAWEKHPYFVERARRKERKKNKAPKQRLYP